MTRVFPLLLAAVLALPGAAFASQISDSDRNKALEALDQNPSDARRVQVQLRQLLNEHPPNLRIVLQADPSLIERADYLAPYPRLAAFLKEHPEVARNPTFFFGQSDFGWYARERTGQERATEALKEVLAGMAVFTVVVTLLIVVASLVRQAFGHRRWLRQSRVQTEVHTKILDRLQSNEEVLAYIQTPAGQQFLESGPEPEARTGAEGDRRPARTHPLVGAGWRDAPRARDRILARAAERIGGSGSGVRCDGDDRGGARRGRHLLRGAVVRAVGAARAAAGEGMRMGELTLSTVDRLGSLDEAEQALHMTEEAFRGFYEQTARPLWTYLARMTGDDRLADDLLQETYYRFLRVKAEFTGDDHRRNYLFRIATNLVRDHRRRPAAAGLAVARRDHRGGARPRGSPHRRARGSPHRSDARARAAQAAGAQPAVAGLRAGVLSRRDRLVSRLEDRQPQGVALPGPSPIAPGPW